MVVYLLKLKLIIIIIIITFSWRTSFHYNWDDNMTQNCFNSVVHWSQSFITTDIFQWKRMFLKNQQNLSYFAIIWILVKLTPKACINKQVSLMTAVENWFGGENELITVGGALWATEFELSSPPPNAIGSPIKIFKHIWTQAWENNYVLKI